MAVLAVALGLAAVPAFSDPEPAVPVTEPRGEAAPYKIVTRLDYLNGGGRIMANSSWYFDAIAWYWRRFGLQFGHLEGAPEIPSGVAIAIAGVSVRQPLRIRATYLVDAFVLGLGPGGSLNDFGLGPQTPMGAPGGSGRTVLARDEINFIDVGVRYVRNYVSLSFGWRWSFVNCLWSEDAPAPVRAQYDLTMPRGVFFALSVGGHRFRSEIPRRIAVVTTSAFGGRDTTTDSDGDGVPDYRDQEPSTPRGAEVDYLGVARDDDGDGVPNGIDRQPFTRRGIPVDQWGMPLDTDHDGVEDFRDSCPNTPADLAVDRQGCPIEVTRIEEELIDVGQFEEQRIHFETARATLLSVSYPRLDVIGMALSGLPELLFEVGGHCDDRGTDEFNQTLSEDRARAVVDYLVGKFPGITPGQFTVVGFGKTRPRVAGTDEAARAQNRRVEFKILNREAAREQVERKRYLQRGEAPPDSLQEAPAPH